MNVKSRSDKPRYELAKIAIKSTALDNMPYLRHFATIKEKQRYMHIAPYLLFRMEQLYADNRLGRR
jgi:hypothetical protein